MSLSNEGLSGSGTAIGDILMFPEAEAYITSFSERPYTVKDIGSPRYVLHVSSVSRQQNTTKIQWLPESDK